MNWLDGTSPAVFLVSDGARMREETTARFGLVGFFGDENLGDEAAVQATIHHLTQRCAKAEFVAFSMSPRDTARRHNIKAHFITRGCKIRATIDSRVLGEGGAKSRDGYSTDTRKGSVFHTLKSFLKSVPFLSGVAKKVICCWRAARCIPGELIFILSSYRIIRNERLAVVIVPGSGCLDDHWFGPWNFPYTLLKWAILARSTGASFCLLSVGASEPNTFLGKLFIRCIVKISNYTSVRDQNSRHVLRDIGCSGVIEVVPDLVHSICRVVDELNEPSCNNEGLVIVGLNAMPFRAEFYWHDSDRYIYDMYVSELAKFCEKVLDNNLDIFLFCTHSSDVKTLQCVVQELDSNAMVVPGRRGSGELRIEAIEDVDALIGSIERADVVVATRFHAVLIALSSGKPVICVSHENKDKQLMRHFGMEKFDVDIAELTGEALFCLFQELMKEIGEVRRGIGGVAARSRDEVGAQWDLIASMAR